MQRQLNFARDIPDAYGFILDQTVRNTKSRTFSSVSLFSGGMGLDVGLESTGRFNLLLCVEKERAFCETIRKNAGAGRVSPGLRIVEDDIKHLDPHELRSR
jgi:DNA (cytosine-5)-methyltransferase 1